MDDIQQHLRLGTCPNPGSSINAGPARATWRKSCLVLEEQHWQLRHSLYAETMRATLFLVALAGAEACDYYVTTDLSFPQAVADCQTGCVGGDCVVHVPTSLSPLAFSSHTPVSLGEGSARSLLVTSEPSGATIQFGGTANAGQRWLKVRFLDATGSLTIENAEVYSFGTTKNGGALKAEGNGTLTLKNVHFRNNVARDGGAIYFEGGPTSAIYVEDSVLELNTASHDGGGLSTLNVTNVDLRRTTFLSNQATRQGGATGLNQATRREEGYNDYYHRTTEVYVQGCNFTDNTALDAGAMYVTMARDVNIYNTLWSANSATDGRGGALEAQLDNNVYLSGNTFEENLALEGEGGAIAFVYSNNTELDNTVLTNNQAGLEGGAIYNIAYTYLFNTFRATDTTFTGNAGSLLYGTTGGGGLFLYRLQLIELTRATFVSNTAQDGGGIYVDGHVLSATISDSTFEQNTGTRNGGAIWFEGTQITSVHGTVIGENEAADLAIEGSTFSANQADSGADVFLQKWTSLYLTCCSGLDTASDESVFSYRGDWDNSIWLHECACGGGCDRITRMPTPLPTPQPTPTPYPTVMVLLETSLTMTGLECDDYDDGAELVLKSIVASMLGFGIENIDATTCAEANNDDTSGRRLDETSVTISITILVGSSIASEEFVADVESTLGDSANDGSLATALAAASPTYSSVVVGTASTSEIVPTSSPVQAGKDEEEDIVHLLVIIGICLAVMLVLAVMVVFMYRKYSDMKHKYELLEARFDPIQMGQNDVQLTPRTKSGAVCLPPGDVQPAEVVKA